MKKILPLLLVLTTLFCLPSNAQNHCIHFDGVDDYLGFPDFFLKNDFTVSFWMKADPVSNGGEDDRVISSGWMNRFELGISDLSCAGDEDDSLWLYDETSGVKCFDSNLRDDKWHHVAATIEGTTRTFYVDGVTVGTFESFANSEYPPIFKVAQWSGGVTNPTHFQGYVDEVRVWNFARSQTEIITTMSCELDGDEEGLIAYWTFNQGVAGGDNSAVTAIDDKSGNEVSGILYNMTLSGETSNFVLSDAFPNTLCTPSATKAILQTAITISPNPSKGLFSVSATDVLRASATIFDSKGALIDAFPFSQKMDVDLSQYADGLYFLQIITEEGTLTKRLLKL